MKRSCSLRLENPHVSDISQRYLGGRRALVCGKIFGIKPDKTDILRHSFNSYLH